MFTDAEAAALNRYFTNTGKPVFALINLPETVKGALFARYSRSAKSLRRLFLDEFYEAAAGDTSRDAVGEERAARLYQRVFNEYMQNAQKQLLEEYPQLQQIITRRQVEQEIGHLPKSMEDLAEPMREMVR